MKLTVSPAAFSKALSSFQSVVPRRTPNPILSTVLLKTHGSSYTLTGTDLNLTLYIKGAAEVHEEGSLCLPVHLLSEIMRKIPAKYPVTLSFCQPSTLVIQKEELIFRLHAFDAQSFPAIQSHEIGQFGTFDVKKLKGAFDATRFCMAGVHDTALDGLYFHPYEDQMRIVSTDTYCLAVSSLKWDLEPFEPIFVGRKAVLELSKMLDPSSKQNISLGFSRHHIVMNVGQSALWANTLQCQFPNYLQVLPKTHKTSIVISQADFCEKLESLNVLNKDRKNLVRLDFKSGSMDMSIHAGLVGSAEEKIHLAYSGDPFSLKFNLTRLLDIIHHLKKETIYLSFMTLPGPVLLTNEEKNPSTFYLLMPLSR